MDQHVAVIQQSLRRYYTADTELVGLSSGLTDSGPVAALRALAGTCAHEDTCRVLIRVTSSDVLF